MPSPLNHFYNFPQMLARLRHLQKFKKCKFRNPFERIELYFKSDPFEWIQLRAKLSPDIGAFVWPFTLNQTEDKS